MAGPEPELAQELEWIKRAQRGDGEAFGFLVEKYKRKIFFLVHHLVRQRQDVEDLSQEVFIKAFRSLPSFSFQASFGTWLSRVAVNHCYDYLRRQRSSRVSYYWQMSEEGLRDLEARAESPQAGGLNNEQRTALRDFVGKLLDRAPVDDRIILSLKELQDYSVEEIAELLKLKPSTVKVRLHRARKRILEDLKQWQDGR
jgi:RNA polymerase sigma-70 factor (ECF subfamily)